MADRDAPDAAPADEFDQVAVERPAQKHHRRPSMREHLCQGQAAHHMTGADVLCGVGQNGHGDALE